MKASRIQEIIEALQKYEENRGTKIVVLVIGCEFVKCVDANGNKIWLQ